MSTNQVRFDLKPQEVEPRGGEFVCDGALDQIEDLKGSNGECGSLKVRGWRVTFGG